MLMTMLRNGIMNTAMKTHLAALLTVLVCITVCRGNVTCQSSIATGAPAPTVQLLVSVDSSVPQFSPFWVNATIVNGLLIERKVDLDETISVERRMGETWVPVSEVAKSEQWPTNLPTVEWKRDSGEVAPIKVAAGARAVLAREFCDPQGMAWVGTYRLRISGAIDLRVPTDPPGSANRVSLQSNWAEYEVVPGPDGGPLTQERDGKTRTWQAYLDVMCLHLDWDALAAGTGGPNRRLLDDLAARASVTDPMQLLRNLAMPWACRTKLTFLRISIEMQRVMDLPAAERNPRFLDTAGQLGVVVSGAGGRDPNWAARARLGRLICYDKMGMQSERQRECAELGTPEMRELLGVANGRTVARLTSR